MSTAMRFVTACVICDAIARAQMRRYSRASSLPLPKRAATAAGRTLGDVGRMASCASCAFFCTFLKILGMLGTYAAPNSSSATWRISVTAPGLMCSPSVRMYVMRPSPHPLPSYRLCAADIARLLPKPSCLDASCCRVEVVKGGLGLRFTSFSDTPCTTSVCTVAACNNAPAASEAAARLFRSNWLIFFPATCVSFPTNALTAELVPSGMRPADTVQNSFLLNISMAISRSHTSRSATLCTRPALSDVLLGSLRHSTPDRLNPNRKSKARRARYASTSGALISRGTANAASTADSVTSVNVTRLTSSPPPSPSQAATSLPPAVTTEPAVSPRVSSAMLPVVSTSVMAAVLPAVSLPNHSTPFFSGSVWFLSSGCGLTSPSSLSSSRICHEMASPSRSGSVARSTMSARLAAAMILSMTSLLAVCSQRMAKSRSGSTDPLLGTRSRTWP
mmetsp:Transcript_3980/g.9561  ORF Transcript_3980/g.9561 Transcript_3980/m.9561 type:complete len:448 (-) Transcript_3980:615-1958(-)